MLIDIPDRGYGATHSVNTANVAYIREESRYGETKFQIHLQSGHSFDVRADSHGEVEKAVNRIREEIRREACCLPSLT